jgi:hypothetical protein
MRTMTLITMCIAALVYGAGSFELGFRAGARASHPLPTFEERFGNWHNRPFHRWHPILPADPGRSLNA